MWLVAVNATGRVVLLAPEQLGLPFADLESLARRLGPIFTGASATLEDAEFLARQTWARWILSDAPAAEAIRSSPRPFQAASALGVISGRDTSNGDDLTS